MLFRNHGCRAFYGYISSSHEFGILVVVESVNIFFFLFSCCVLWVVSSKWFSFEYYFWIFFIIIVIIFSESNRRRYLEFRPCYRTPAKFFFSFFIFMCFSFEYIVFFYFFPIIGSSTKIIYEFSVTAPELLFFFFVYCLPFQRHFIDFEYMSNVVVITL